MSYDLLTFRCANDVGIAQKSNDAKLSCEKVKINNNDAQTKTAHFVSIAYNNLTNLISLSID